MAKRYYLCDVETVNNGDFDETRPVIAEYPVNWVGEISPDETKAVVLVNAANHGQLVSDERIDPLPVFPLDAKINAMNSQAKNAMISVMEKRGLSTGLISSADGYRDVIRSIGREMNPNFDENNFDVSE